MNFSQYLTAAATVAGMFGGNFSEAMVTISFVLSAITSVEAMKGMTGPQKLEAVKKLIEDGVNSVPVLHKLVADPAKMETMINQLVAVANMFVK